MKKIYKFLLIFALFFIIFLCINNVYATDIDIPHAVLNKNDTVGYNSNNLIFRQFGSNDTYLILFPSANSTYLNDLSYGSWYYTVSHNNYGFITPMWLPTYYVKTTDNGLSWSSASATPDAFFNDLSYSLVWSKNNVYYTGIEGYEGTVFFPLPVTEEPEEEEPALETQEILAPIVEEVETDKVLQEVILLLPILMIVLISIIAFWKAWAWLKGSLDL